MHEGSTLQKRMTVAPGGFQEWFYGLLGLGATSSSSPKYVEMGPSLYLQCIYMLLHVSSVLLAS